jgi:hypothetical protein
MARNLSGRGRSKPALHPTENNMNVHLSLGPLISLLAGILILIMPRLLNYIVAVYLIIIGVVGLFGGGHYI